MPSTLTRAPTGAARRPPASRPNPPVARPAAPDRRRRELDGLATLALGAVTAMAALGLGRLYEDAGFVAPVLSAAAASHLLAAVLRRRGVPFRVAGSVSLLALAVMVVLVVEPHTTTYGIPGGETLRALTGDLADAWRRFGEVVAPTPVTPGFVAASVIGVWVVALAADTAAFRVGAPFEAAIPSFTLFIFGAVLGADRHRVGYSVAYLASLLVFLLLLGAARRSVRVSWLAGRDQGGALAIVKGGLVLVGVAVMAALLLGPSLPGAKSEALVSWRPQKDNGPSSRVTVSPLVDIRNRLVDQSNREVFTASSNVPSYWRLTSLDRFDGQIWSSLGTYRPAKRSLPPGGPSAPSGRRAQQRFTISALSSIWLPAAYRPVQLESEGRVRYDDDSSSLLAEAPTSDGLAYAVASDLPALAGEQLATVRAAVPRDVARRYLSLPEDLPARVIALAEQVTGVDHSRCAGTRCTQAELAAQSSSPFRRARLLQDWFRSNFTYDLRVAPGHDNAALERFVFETRRGYCEQFAGSYAAMARAVGLPARVAVGFTPGDSGGPNSYRVLGRHAHAWPEIYFEGVGWTAFEPTPGRGMPGAEDYTGVVPPPSGAGESGSTATTGLSTATTASLAAQPPPAPELPAPDPEPPARSASSGVLGWVVGVLLVLVALMAMVPVARRWRRQRRRAAADTPAARVLLAWAEASDHLTTAGHPRRPSETLLEYAVRVRSVSPAAAEPLDDLASDAGAASFSSASLPAEVAVRAQRAADLVGERVRSEAGRWRRLRWAVDPRTLLWRADGGPTTRRA